MEEIWKDIPELKGKYQCSNLGRIRKINKDPRSPLYKYFKLQIIRKGYLSANPTRTYRKTVHRIVALLFIPNPENKPCVNHKDFNVKNNCASNLEWCTYKENSSHGWNIGLMKPKKTNLGKFGKYAPASKKIIAMDLIGRVISSHDSITEASRLYKISNSSISNCLTKRTKTGGGIIWLYA